MNDLAKAELEVLKRRQEALQAQISALTSDIRRVEQRLLEPAPVIAPVAEAPVPAPAPPPLPPIVEPAVFPAMQPMAPAPAQPAAGDERFQPLPTRRSVEAIPEVAPAALASSPAAAAAPEPTRAPMHESLATAKPSFEVRLGTYWLVRVGIVMLLTGLVFLGTYAYKNFIGRLGAGGKLALLYAAGAGLLGLGAWLQRKREKEGVRNYGQVLFAGGLATVYFTTYAAHYLPVLRVISSATIDGLLLLAWAAVIAFIADRRKSEVLAIFGIGLAYYTSAITQVGLFTLYSNLLLTAAAAFFVVRRRWTALSIISLVATYGGFAYWRFYNGDWTWDAHANDLLAANSFLAGYWILFTVAAFLSRAEKIRNEARAMFAAANNGAFFGLVLLSMIHAPRGHFWEFALGFGAVLLVAAAAAGRWLADEPAVKQGYLLQGVVLVTIGLIAKFAGLRLALLLAAECAVLTFFGNLRRNLLLRMLGCLCGGLSALWVVFGLAPNATHEHWMLGVGVGALLAASAWLQHRTEPATSDEVRPWTSLLCALALAACGVTTWEHVPAQWLPVTFALEAVLFTVSLRIIGIRELAVLGQSLLVAAQCVWMFRAFGHEPQPWWSVATVLAATVGLSHWWQWQQRRGAIGQVATFIQVLYASAAVALLFLWLHPQFQPSSWLALANFLAVALTLYAVLTRSWILGALSQAFALVGVWEFARQLITSGGRPEWYLALTPIAAWLLLGLATSAWLARRPETPGSVARPLLDVSIVYRWVAVGMSLWWIHIYFAARFHFPVLVALGAGLVGLAAGLKKPGALPFSLAYFLAGIGVIAMLLATDAAAALHPLNLLALLFLLVLQQLVRRTGMPVPPRAHDLAIGVTTALVWVYVSRWVSLKAGGGHVLTASWAALAFLVFSGGFALREKLYRWMGLAMLTCAVARVFLFDVWKLETIYRILSFMALGIVLLALGFIYNKYQDRWREWL